MRSALKCLDALAAIAMIAASGAVILSLTQSRRLFSDNSGDSDTFARAVEDIDGTDSVAGVLDGASTLGSESAKVALLEFMDYECQFCARHAADTFREIQKDFISAGKLRYVVLHFPLRSIHAFAEKAAQAAWCAGGVGRFWDMHRRLYLNQKTLTDAALSRYAEDLGIDAGTFSQCMADPNGATRIRADVALATRLGISSTPSFLIGKIEGDRVYPIKRITGAVPYPVFGQVISGLLGVSRVTASDLLERGSGG